MCVYFSSCILFNEKMSMSKAFFFLISVVDKNSAATYPEADEYLALKKISIVLKFAINLVCSNFFREINQRVHVRGKDI